VRIVIRRKRDMDTAETGFGVWVEAVKKDCDGATLLD
jgi:hypothetical protein